MEYIAHRTEEGREQSVSLHCAETANRCKQYGENLGMEHLCQLIGLLHDAGKLCQDFQAYIRGDNRFHRGSIDHSSAGAKYLCELSAAYGDGKMQRTARLIARVILSHHGLHDWLLQDGTDYLERRIGTSERYAEVREQLQALYTDEQLVLLLRNATEEFMEIDQKIKWLAAEEQKRVKKSPETKSFYFGMTERLLESMLMDADRTDTADFMLNQHTEEKKNPKLWDEMQLRMEERLRSFGTPVTAIDRQRADISERCAVFAGHPVGVCRLIVPTGGGKTLASLRFAIAQCQRYEKDRIFYIAPFMSILEQNSDEIRQIVGEGAFLEHHSNMLADMNQAEELAMYELHAERWDMPVIATTMVQFLHTLFLGKTTSVRRMHRLCNAVIIVDEIQSLPRKCVHLWNLAMNFLANVCNCTIVLCSATQPLLEYAEHPLLLDAESSMTGEYHRDFEVFRRTELLPHINKFGMTYDEAADFCLEQCREQGNLLLIVNTKAAAKEIYQNLRERILDGTRLLHLSTAMCPAHRQRKLQELREILAKNQSVICVTTQLIEAGVDISFRCVVRSLAGLDNAAQAAGRCNRHGEAGRICPVYLVHLKEEQLGNLPEISETQDATRRLLESGQYEDLLSVEAQSAYFQILFQSMPRGTLSYPEKDGITGTTLVKLLSCNPDRVNLAREERRYCMEGQAFQTAGRLFEVIAEWTEDVIVPADEEAKQLIETLRRLSVHEDLLPLLRRCQKYTVGISEYMLRHFMEERGIETLACDVRILDERFYDKELGVVMDGTAWNPAIF